jgi:topoisomerase-4 subunit A
MGSFHPHGDQAIYDALVRLAQDFSSRYPLVDGQGNFGNIDGDNAAAYALHRSALTEVARLLLEGIDEDGVDFRRQLRRQSKEPVVLPGGFPESARQRLAGHRGRHGDLDPAAQRRRTLRRRAASDRQARRQVEALLKMGQGSGFSDRRHHRRFQGEHRRSLHDRARLVPRAAPNGPRKRGRGTWVVVITEIPWLVQKSRLVEKIAELLNEKKLPLVGDVRDESAEDVRLVIEPKSRTVDPELLMESLFRLTELESRIPLNLNVLVKGRIPKVLGLAECLREWLDHLRDVLLRRSNYRKEQIEHRLEVLGGYLIAYLNIDKVIKIIRTEDEPKPALMKAFKLTEVQADAILNMRLRNLRKLEEMEIRTEDKNLARVEGHQGRCSAPKPSNGPRSASRSARSATSSGRRRRSASAAPPSPTRPSTILPRSRKPSSSASRSRWWFPTRAGCAR